MNEIWGMVKTPQFWIWHRCIGFRLGYCSKRRLALADSKFQNILSGLSKKWATRTAKLKKKSGMLELKS